MVVAGLWSVAAPRYRAAFARASTLNDWVRTSLLALSAVGASLTGAAHKR